MYVNHIGSDDGSSRVRAAHGSNYELVAVKARFDPDNLFRLNSNIAAV